MSNLCSFWLFECRNLRRPESKWGVFLFSTMNRCEDGRSCDAVLTTWCSYVCSECITHVQQMWILCHCTVDRLISPERVIKCMTECLISVYICAQRQAAVTTPCHNGRAHCFLQFSPTRSRRGSSRLLRVVTSKSNWRKFQFSSWHFVRRFPPRVKLCDHHVWFLRRDSSSCERRPRLCTEMANHERNKKILLELVKQPLNNRCADCGAAGKRHACHLNVIPHLKELLCSSFRFD